MKSNPKAPTSVTIMVLTVITILFWIGFEVFRVVTTKPAPNVPREILLPLSPTLDSDTLTKLQQRVYLEDAEIGNTIVAGKVNVSPVTPTNTPTPQPSTSPQPTGLISPTPSTSQSPSPTQTP